MTLRILLTLLTSACAAGGTSDVQNKKKDKLALTLQMQERYRDGQTQAALILCQHHRCLNPLRHADGSEFYFQDHAEAYNTFTQKHGVGEKVKFALLGIAVVAGSAGIILLLRHGWKGRRLDKHFPLVDAQGNKVDLSEISKGDRADKTVKYYVSDNTTLTAEEAKKLNRAIDQSFGAGVTAAAIGTASWATVFGMELTTNPHWRRKQKDFAALFMQGKRIVVNRQELAALLRAMNEKLGVRIAPNVTHLLYGR